MSSGGWLQRALTWSRKESDIANRGSLLSESNSDATYVSFTFRGGLLCQRGICEESCVAIVHLKAATHLCDCRLRVDALMQRGEGKGEREKKKVGTAAPHPTHLLLRPLAREDAREAADRGAAALDALERLKGVPSW